MSSPFSMFLLFYFLISASLMKILANETEITTSSSESSIMSSTMMTQTATGGTTTTVANSAPETSAKTTTIPREVTTSLLASQSHGLTQCSVTGGSLCAIVTKAKALAKKAKNAVTTSVLTTTDAVTTSTQLSTTGSTSVNPITSTESMTPVKAAFSTDPLTTITAAKTTASMESTTTAGKPVASTLPPPMTTTPGLPLTTTPSPPLTTTPSPPLTTVIPSMISTSFWNPVTSTMPTIQASSTPYFGVTSEAISSPSADLATTTQNFYDLLAGTPVTTLGQLQPVTVAPTLSSSPTTPLDGSTGAVSTLPWQDISLGTTASFPSSTPSTLATTTIQTKAQITTSTQSSTSSSPTSIVARSTIPLETTTSSVEWTSEAVTTSVGTVSVATTGQAAESSPGNSTIIANTTRASVKTLLGTILKPETAYAQAGQRQLTSTVTTTSQTVALSTTGMTSTSYPMTPTSTSYPVTSTTHPMPSTFLHSTTGGTSSSESTFSSGVATESSYPSEHASSSFPPGYTESLLPSGSSTATWGSPSPSENDTSKSNESSSTSYLTSTESYVTSDTLASIFTSGTNLTTYNTTTNPASVHTEFSTNSTFSGHTISDTNFTQFAGTTASEATVGTGNATEELNCSNCTPSTPLHPSVETATGSGQTENATIEITQTQGPMLGNTLARFLVPEASVETTTQGTTIGRTPNASISVSNTTQGDTVITSEVTMSRGPMLGNTVALFLVPDASTETTTQRTTVGRITSTSTPPSSETRAHTETTSEVTMTRGPMLGGTHAMDLVPEASLGTTIDTATDTATDITTQKSEAGRTTVISAAQSHGTESDLTVHQQTSPRKITSVAALMTTEIEETVPMDLMTTIPTNVTSVTSVKTTNTISANVTSTKSTNVTSTTSIYSTNSPDIVVYSQKPEAPAETSVSPSTKSHNSTEFQMEKSRETSSATHQQVKFSTPVGPTTHFMPDTSLETASFNDISANDSDETVQPASSFHPFVIGMNSSKKVSALDILVEIYSKPATTSSQPIQTVPATAPDLAASTERESRLTSGPAPLPPAPTMGLTRGVSKSQPDWANLTAGITVYTRRSTSDDIVSSASTPSTRIYSTPAEESNKEQSLATIEENREPTTAENKERRFIEGSVVSSTTSVHSSGTTSSYHNVDMGGKIDKESTGMIDKESTGFEIDKESTGLLTDEKITDTSTQTSVIGSNVIKGGWTAIVNGATTSNGNRPFMTTVQGTTLDDMTGMVYTTVDGPKGPHHQEQTEAGVAVRTTSAGSPMPEEITPPQPVIATGAEMMLHTRQASESGGLLVENMAPATTTEKIAAPATTAENQESPDEIAVVYTRRPTRSSTSVATEVVATETQTNVDIASGHFPQSHEVTEGFTPAPVQKGSTTTEQEVYTVSYGDDNDPIVMEESTHQTQDTVSQGAGEVSGSNSDLSVVAFHSLSNNKSSFYKMSYRRRPVTTDITTTSIDIASESMSGGVSEWRTYGSFYTMQDKTDAVSTLEPKKEAQTHQFAPLSGSDSSTQISADESYATSYNKEAAEATEVEKATEVAEAMEVEEATEGEQASDASETPASAAPRHQINQSRDQTSQTEETSPQSNMASMEAVQAHHSAPSSATNFILYTSDNGNQAAATASDHPEFSLYTAVAYHQESENEEMSSEALAFSAAYIPTPVISLGPGEESTATNPSKSPQDLASDTSQSPQFPTSDMSQSPPFHISLELVASRANSTSPQSGDGPTRVVQETTEIVTREAAVVDVTNDTLPNKVPDNSTQLTLCNERAVTDDEHGEKLCGTNAVEQTEQKDKIDAKGVDKTDGIVNSGVTVNSSATNSADEEGVTTNSRTTTVNMVNQIPVSPDDRSLFSASDSAMSVLFESNSAASVFSATSASSVPGGSSLTTDEDTAITDRTISSENWINKNSLAPVYTRRMGSTDTEEGTTMMFAEGTPEQMTTKTMIEERNGKGTTVAYASAGHEMMTHQAATEDVASTFSRIEQVATVDMRDDEDPKSNATEKAGEATPSVEKKGTEDSELITNVPSGNSIPTGVPGQSVDQGVSKASHAPVDQDVSMAYDATAQFHPHASTEESRADPESDIKHNTPAPPSSKNATAPVQTPRDSAVQTPRDAANEDVTKSSLSSNSTIDDTVEGNTKLEQSNELGTAVTSAGKSSTSAPPPIEGPIVTRSPESNGTDPVENVHSISPPGSDENGKNPGTTTVNVNINDKNPGTATVSTEAQTEAFCFPSEWAPYGPCSSTCGTGTMVRYKQYNAAPLPAIECKVETELAKCTDLPQCNPMTEVAKVASNVMMKIGCIWILGGLGLAIFSFMCLRHHYYLQVIHVNEDISLFLAHLVLLLFAIRDDSQFSHDICRVVAISLQYFFSVTFLLQAVEALHIYTVLTNVVVGNDAVVNVRAAMAICWGLPVVVSGVTAATSYRRLLSDFSCWINIGDNVCLATAIPVGIWAVATIVLLEASGHSTTTRKSTNITSVNLARGGLAFVFSAQFPSWFMTASALYYQKWWLFTVVLGLNITLGIFIYMYHVASNEKARLAAKMFYRWLRKRNKRVAPVMDASP